MSKQIFTISMEVLSSLSPKKGMLNAPIGDLENQTFVLHSTVAPENRKAQLEKASEDNLFVKARYINKATSKSFLIPIRGLLNMGLVKLGSENAKFDEESTPVSKVHEYLMETIGEGKNISLPAEFTVVSVKPRTQQNTDAVMYPLYVYDRFNEKVKELRAEDPKASLDPIYDDFEFIQSLYADGPSDRFVNPEPNKDLIISI